MEKYNIKVNYLFNSGFLIETKNYLLIFDYYLDCVDEGQRDISNGVITEKELFTNKKILVFTSHGHEDHFNSGILGWKKIRQDIKYILSSDIELEDKDESINIVSPYDTLDIEGISIKTYGSTDAGVSFWLKVDDVNIFHAGDLNWWHWFDEPEDFNENQERVFKQEIERIKENKIDIAFFPVDPRLIESYYLGGEYFIKELNPKILIPMHFGRDYEAIKKFTSKVANYETRVLKIAKRGEEILL